MLSANPFVIIFYFFPFFVVLKSAIVMAVIGLMISVNKVKPTRILGAAYIMSAVMTVFSLALIFVDAAVPFQDELKSGLGTTSTIISFICSVGVSICVFLFLHKRYGAKLVCIPVIIVPVIGAVADVVAYVLHRPGVGLLNSYWIELIRCIIDFITATVSSISVIFVLHKNRKKEDIIPRIWSFRILIYVWTVVMFVYNSMTHILDIVSLSVPMEDWNRKSRIWNAGDVLDGMKGLLMIIGCHIALIIPIYILARVLRRSKKIRSESGKLLN